jgi:hypothetical protein
MAWESWQAAKQHRKFALRCIGKMQNRTLSRAFAALRDHLERTWEAKAILGRTLAKIKASLLLSALRGWRQASSAQLERRGRAQLVIRRLVNGRLASAFAGWAFRAADLRNMRTALNNVTPPPLFKTTTTTTCAFL